MKNHEVKLKILAELKKFKFSSLFFSQTKMWLMWYQIIVFSCVTMTDLTNHILVHPSMRFLIRNIFELIELLPKFPNIVHNKKNCTVLCAYLLSIAVVWINELPHRNSVAFFIIYSRINEQVWETICFSRGEQSQNQTMIIDRNTKN